MRRLLLLCAQNQSPSLITTSFEMGSGFNMVFQNHVWIKRKFTNLIAQSAVPHFLKYFLRTSIFEYSMFLFQQVSAFFFVENGWYLEKWDIFILSICTERAWIIVMIFFFSIILCRNSSSSICVVHIHSFISVCGIKLYYLIL